jgi:hypothetical protein
LPAVRKARIAREAAVDAYEAAEGIGEVDDD